MISTLPTSSASNNGHSAVWPTAHVDLQPQSKQPCDTFARGVEGGTRNEKPTVSATSAQR
eukprot:2611898-Alexandrium_andersonii.AAC.1